RGPIMPHWADFSHSRRSASPRWNATMVAGSAGGSSTVQAPSPNPLRTPARASGRNRVTVIRESMVAPKAKEASTLHASRRGRTGPASRPGGTDAPASGRPRRKLGLDDPLGAHPDAFREPGPGPGARCADVAGADGRSGGAVGLWPRGVGSDGVPAGP